jgi:hypothetical protein
MILRQTPTARLESEPATSRSQRPCIAMGSCMSMARIHPYASAEVSGSKKESEEPCNAADSSRDVIVSATRLARIVLPPLKQRLAEFVFEPPY